jgi:4-amino-4-deoxychorismate lyase
VKATSYAVNMASLRHAQAEGADDVVWVSTDGEVLEAPTATVGWVTDGRLLTPPSGDVGILPGTTADIVLGLCDQIGAAHEVRRGTVDELQRADEVLMMSSVRGVAPVTELDGRSLGIGPVTAALRDAFERLLVSG